jgi:hypothetical protein
MTAAGRTSWPRFIFYCCVALVIYSCAKTGMPPGGAEDKSGPTILAHYPPADAVNVERRMIASLEFSEPVNRSSVEASLFLAPEPGNRLKYRWRGRSLDLIYLDSLAENRTYVITVGSAIKDLRGNPAGQPYTIAFATGAQIDRGRIGGLIADEETPNVISIWAYDLALRSAPDPAQDAADYALQADRNGYFKFGYLRLGNYRVFAVHDRNLNRRWDMAGETIGIPPWDVVITDSAESYLSFRMSNQDTSKIGIVRVKEIDARRLEVRFSRRVDDAEEWTLSSDHGVLVHAKLLRYSKDEPNTAYVFAEEPLTKGTWIISGSINEFPQPYVATDTFTVQARPDTSRPKIVRQIPDGKLPARELSRFELYTDEPVRISPIFADSCRIVSNNQETLSVHLVGTTSESDVSHGVTSISLVGEPPFVEGQSYTLQFDGRWIMDLDSNYYADSSAALNFAFYTADSLGSVRGIIVGMTTGARVVLRPLAAGVVTAQFTGNREFIFSRIPPGDCVAIVKAAEDVIELDAGFGGLFPFQFSVPFILAPDTLTVRARWETETTIHWDVHP